MKGKNEGLGDKERKTKYWRNQGAGGEGGLSYKWYHCSSGQYFPIKTEIYFLHHVNIQKNSDAVFLLHIYENQSSNISIPISPLISILGFYTRYHFKKTSLQHAGPLMILGSFFLILLLTLCNRSTC